MRQEKALKFHWDTRNNKALPLDSACHECLSVHSPTILPYSNNKFKKNLQNLEILIPLPEVTVNNNPKKRERTKWEGGQPASQPASIIAL
jgi:hypothetical protein